MIDVLLKAVRLVGSTIVSNEDLVQAVHDALKLDRDQVLAGSQRWTWERAWAIFRDNLVTKL